MDIGKIIRQARLRRGLTQQEIADAFGISRAAVAAWEKKGIRPTIDRLAVLARLLDIPLADLIGEHPAPAVAEAPVAYASDPGMGALFELLQLFGALDARDRITLLEIAKGLAKSAAERR